MGDGSITKGGLYQCSHSHKQLDFINYKYRILENLTSPNFTLDERIVSNYQNGKEYRTLHFRTMQNEQLKELRNVFYPNGLKIFPMEYFKGKFNQISLAFWYMGDGSRKGNIASIYTYGFGIDGNAIIKVFLKEIFQIDFDIKIDNMEKRGDKAFFLSTIKGENSQKFFEIVAPHIIPSMQYKLPVKFRGRYQNIFE